MDKSDWEISLNGLESLLKQRRRDIEELELTIAAYKKKIADLPDVPKTAELKPNSLTP
jgi:hypothetical protein